jgi:hypothetical protein
MSNSGELPTFSLRGNINSEPNQRSQKVPGLRWEHVLQHGRSTVDDLTALAPIALQPLAPKEIIIQRYRSLHRTALGARYVGLKYSIFP